MIRCSIIENLYEKPLLSALKGYQHTNYCDVNMRRGGHIILFFFAALHSGLFVNENKPQSYPLTLHSTDSVWETLFSRGNLLSLTIFRNYVPHVFLFFQEPWDGLERSDKIRQPIPEMDHKRNMVSPLRNTKKTR